MKGAAGYRSSAKGQRAGLSMRFAIGLFISSLLIAACGASDVVLGGSGGSASTGGSGDTGGNGDTGGTGLPCDVVTALSNSCTSCHGDPLNNSAPFPLLTLEELRAASGVDPSQTVAARCLARMNDNDSPMPPTFFASRASGADRTAFSNWINAGLPGGSCSTMTGSGGGSDGAGGGDAASGGGTDSSGGGTANGGGTASTGGSSATGGSSGGGSSSSGGGTAVDYTQCHNTSTSCVDASGAGDYACISSTTTTGFPSGATTCTSDASCPYDFNCWTSGSTKKCLQACGSSALSGGAGGGGGTGGGTAGTGGGSSGTGGSTGTGGGSSSCGTDTWANYGQSFFSSTCDSCHHHTNEFTSAAIVRSSKSTITSHISSGSMPQGTSLSSAAKARILAYLACGSP